MRLILILFALSLTTINAQRPDPWTYPPDNYNWNPSWNARPSPRSGVCLFKKANFSGDRFCVRRGDKLDHLPGNFGDNVSSIQLFGGARVVVFNDRHFSGGSAQFDRSIADLRNAPFRGGHTWNNRISSVAVR